MLANLVMGPGHATKHSCCTQSRNSSGRGVSGCRTQNVALEMQHPEFPGASRKENAGPRNSMAVAQNRAGRLCEPDDGFTGKGMEPVSRRLIFSLCQIDSSGTAYGIDPH